MREALNFRLCSSIAPNVAQSPEVIINVFESNLLISITNDVNLLRFNEIFPCWSLRVGRDSRIIVFVMAS